MKTKAFALHLIFVTGLVTLSHVIHAMNIDGIDPHANELLRKILITNAKKILDKKITMLFNQKFKNPKILTEEEQVFVLNGIMHTQQTCKLLPHEIFFFSTLFPQTSKTVQRRVTQFVKSSAPKHLCVTPHH